MKLALHDDGNLARLLLSSIHKILQSINDSIPNQVSTARNFPASASPGQNASFVPSSSLAPPSSEVPQLASHARKDCGERKNQYPENQGKGKPNGPAATSRSVAAAAAISAQTKMVKHARLQPPEWKSFGYQPFVSLAKADKTWQQKICSGIARCHNLAALVAFSSLSCMCGKIDDLQPGAGLGCAGGELGVLFLCQLIFCGWILIRFEWPWIDWYGRK
jgi:hypothetical protein